MHRDEAIPNPRPQFEMIPAAPEPAGWSGAAFADGDDDGGGVDMGRYLHAMRRRWLVALILALPLSAATTYVTWVFLPKQYVATAVLRVTSSGAKLVFDTADESKSAGNTFDIYKRTQRQLLRSRFVLTAALRDDEALARVPVFLDQTDPVAWLETNVNVTFPDESEVMHVSIAADRPEGLNQLINAVVESYFEEVVYAERKQKQKRLDYLEVAYTKYETDLRAKQVELNRILDQLGTGDAKTLTPVQQKSLDKYKSLQSQASKIEWELVQARGELRLREGTGEADGQEPEVSEFDLLEAMRTDRKSEELQASREHADEVLQEARKKLGPGGPENKLAPYVDRLKKIDEKIANRKDELRRELIERKRVAATSSLEALKKKVIVLEDQQKSTEGALQAVQSEFRGGPKTSIDAEMLKSYVARLQKLLDEVGAEIEHTKIESQREGETPSERVVLLNKAQPATRVADAKSKFSKVIGAGTIAFLLPLVLVVWLDARRQCINSGSDVVGGLGLSVIGTVPMVPPRIMRKLGGNSTTQRYWRTLLSESVDSVAAVLLRGSRSSGMRAVMVSSATSGEGKTTLAANLATSLAGAGRRTILVDFDLRRPALHHLLDLSLEPGISELLDDPGMYGATVQMTQISNLAFLAAGRWTATGLSGLAIADLKGLFDRLRANFDFVVVDGSPVLPIVDTRLIAQHVDTVVLSVIRDVSRTPRVRAACELLGKFNISVFGVVVTGSKGDAYPDSSYQRYAVKAV